MKYFAKLLPTVGEIKEGDWFMYQNIIYRYITALDQGMSTEGLQKYKLFLCSRDIQVGDIYTCDHKGKGIDVGKGVPSPVQVYTTYSKDKNLCKDCYKVIGEISKAAIWVKEGDEFDENQIKRDVLIKDTFDGDDGYIHLYPKGNEKVRELGTTEKFIKEYDIKILCPTCKNFH